VPGRAVEVGDRRAVARQAQASNVKTGLREALAKEAHFVRSAGEAMHTHDTDAVVVALAQIERLPEHIASLSHRCVH